MDKLTFLLERMSRLNCNIVKSGQFGLMLALAQPIELHPWVLLILPGRVAAGNGGILLPFSKGGLYCWQHQSRTHCSCSRLKEGSWGFSWDILFSCQPAVLALEALRLSSQSSALMNVTRILIGMGMICVIRQCLFQTLTVRRSCTLICGLHGLLEKNSAFFLVPQNFKDKLARNARWLWGDVFQP